MLKEETVTGRKWDQLRGIWSRNLFLRRLNCSKCREFQESDPINVLDLCPPQLWRSSVVKRKRHACLWWERNGSTAGSVICSPVFCGILPKGLKAPLCLSSLGVWTTAPGLCASWKKIIPGKIQSKESLISNSRHIKYPGPPGSRKDTVFRWRVGWAVLVRCGVPRAAALRSVLLPEALVGWLTPPNVCWLSG